MSENILSRSAQYLQNDVGQPYSDSRNRLDQNSQVFIVRQPHFAPLLDGQMDLIDRPISIWPIKERLMFQGFV
jgi:hypothetical protein